MPRPRMQRRTTRERQRSLQNLHDSCRRARLSWQVRLGSAACSTTKTATRRSRSIRNWTPRSRTPRRRRGRRADVAGCGAQAEARGSKSKEAAAKAAATAKARKPAKSVTKAAPAKAASNRQKPAKAAKAKKAAVKSRPRLRRHADLTGVKAGAHTLWVSKDLAGALTSKDRRKLKALLKRAEKRRKAQKK